MYGSTSALRFQNSDMSLDELVATLVEYENAGGPVTLFKAQTTDSFDQVKSRFGMSVPPEFEQLYSAYDCIEFGPIELLPVNRLVECYDSIHDIFPSLATEFVPFIADDAGGYFVVGFAKSAEPNAEFGAIFYVPPINPPELEFRSSSLFAFLVNWVRERIDLAF